MVDSKPGSGAGDGAGSAGQGLWLCKKSRRRQHRSTEPGPAVAYEEISRNSPRIRTPLDFRPAATTTMGACASSKRVPSPLAKDATLEPPSSHFGGPHDDIVNGIAATGCCGEWLSCAEDCSVGLCSWAGCRLLERWHGHEKGVLRVLPMPQLKGAVSASRDTSIRLWRRGSPEAVQVLRGHELAVTALALNGGTGELCSGSRDSYVRLWDLGTAQSLRGRHISRNVVTCMAWIPGERQVLQGSEDLKLRLWDVRTLQPTATLEGNTYFPLACDCAGPYCLTGSNGFDGDGCELRLWDRRKLEQVTVFGGHDQAVVGVAFLHSAGGEGVCAASASKDGSVRVWDLLRGACIAETIVPGGASALATAVADEPHAQLYVGDSSGGMHAYRATGADGADLRLLATATPRA